MDVKKGRKNIAVWIIVISLLINLWYWYELRPYLAIKNCHKIALDNTGYNPDQWQIWASKDKNKLNYSFVYALCTHKEGINPL